VKITTFSDYALRLLMMLAVSEDELVTIADVANAYGVSKSHVMKVANLLGRAGMVATARGRSGGLRLARPASVIRVGEVLRLTEPDFDVVPCFESSALCRITPDCVLKKALAAAVRAFLHVLDGYTVEDLATPHRELRAILGMDRLQNIDG